MANERSKITGLTLRQMEFCENYVKFRNKQKAYAVVYECNATTAKTNSRKLLKDERIQQYIKEIRERIEYDAVLSAQQVLEEYTKIATATDSTKMEKLKALDALGKHYQMFHESSTVNHNINPIQIINDLGASK